MKEITVERKAVFRGEYDVIVAGGGVAGVAAAVSAARMGKSVLLIEKTINLGGLATTGLINLYEPLDNGRGTQIIRGMAEELQKLSIKYGYDSIPEVWKNGEPGQGNTDVRYVTRYSAPIFMLALNELINNEGVKVLFDTIITEPVMENGKCLGLVVENKTGCGFYGAKMIVDTTGDADVIYRAGVPTVQGSNYHTYLTHGADLDTCRTTLEKEDMNYLYDYRYKGGGANLWGTRHPEGKPKREGTTAEDITEYVIENQLECLEKIKDDDRKKRTIVALPYMPQFRTTRRIDGDFTLREEDAYRHFDDSVAAICDFARRDYLYEVPFGTLVKTGFSNLITAGRCASGDGYAWDVLRVIPPAVITGQVAGIACAMAIDEKCDIYALNVLKLQKILASKNIDIHFDDSLIPKTYDNSIDANDGHM